MSKVHRFHAGLLETASGPAIGAGADFLELMLKARDASLDSDESVRFGDYLNFGLQNAPYINMFYTRVGLDFLFLNSMREAAKPGYLKRVARQRKAEYGQESMIKDHLKPFGR